ncbi:MAG: FtsX-like permease family protein [Acidimicrobiia bacterium]|nr:FtsX-like permease family protein [Acidimicrobiia bacterium]
MALAIIIALLGIANSLALSIFERTREIGLLRAVGMTRAQVRSTIRWESVIIALMGTLIGLVVSLFFGYAIFQAIKDTGFETFSLPIVQLAFIVVIAAVAGVVAAIFPARRAAKLDVLEAIMTE